MKPLFVKELSKLTKVSVRTLHYYDNIGLLKPSQRMPNGYRIYSSQDLEKLEKIIVLKFFGFTLNRIKAFLSHEPIPLDQLEKQLALLQSEVSFLHEAQNNLLKRAISECKDQMRIDWHALVSQITAHIKTSKRLRGGETDFDVLAQVSKESSEHQAQWQKIIDKLNATKDTDHL